MSRIVFTAILGSLLHLSAMPAEAAPIDIVAAENFYGDLATQIGGKDVAVSSILSNPNQDPHLFEASPATARLLADADIVLYNGVDYDPWMDKLLSASRPAHRTAIVAATLLGRKSGDNPHLWYDTATMPAMAEALTGELGQRDPAHADDYRRRLAAFEASLAPIVREIAAIRQAHAGTAVTATEPVFGYTAAALGLVMRNERFQLDVMNDTDPSPAEIAGIEGDLKAAKVKMLFYNSQVTDELTKRLLDLARQSHVAVVGVSETEPPATDYQHWMTGQLDAVRNALDGPTH